MIWTLLTQSYWRDEVFRIFMAREPLLKIIQLAPFDAQPPFYYFVLHFWIKLFGDTEIATRALSLIFFELTVFIGYKFGEKILPKTKYSVAVALLLMLNPLLIYYAFEARMYMLFIFLVSWSFYSLWNQKKKSWVLSSVLALYTHNFMIFALAAQFLWLVFNRRILAGLKKEIILAVLLYLPWLPVVWQQTHNVESGFWISPVSFTGVLPLVSGVFAGYDGDPSALFNLFAVLSVILIILVLISFSKKNRQIWLYLFLWFLIPVLFVLILSIFGSSVFLVRYLSFLVVPLVLLLALVADKKRKIIKIGVVVFLLCLSVYLNFLLYPYRLKTDIRKTVSTIAFSVKPEDLILTTSLNYFETSYYFAKFTQDRYTMTVPVKIYSRDKTVPFYVGKVLIPDEDVVSQVPQDRRVFFVQEDGGFSLSLPVFR